MFSRDKSAARPARQGPSGLSFIGPEVVVSGDVVTSAHLHVDGRIQGDVRCAQLCQGASGTIAGGIEAEEARIAGLVEGTVSAGSVVLEASARVTGDVAYETISIAAGARVDGRLACRAADSAAAGPPLLVATPSEPSGAKASGKAAGAPHALFPLDGEAQAAE